MAQTLTLAPIEKQKSSRSEWYATVLVIVISSLFLCGPAFLNKSPFLFSDTRAYYLGGHMAAEKALFLFSKLWYGTESTIGAENLDGTLLDGTLKNVVGVRSAWYGLFIYLLSLIGSLWAVAVAQGLIVSYVCFTLYRQMCPSSNLIWFVTVIFILSMFTSLSWFTSYMMPDIFTGVLLLCILIIGFFRRYLSLLQFSLISFILCFSISAHTSNLFIATAMVIIVFFLLLCRGAGGWESLRTSMLLIVPMVLAAAANLMVGVVGFHQWTISPQRPPFLLARAIADGPVRLYLEEHCSSQDWILCRYSGTLPDNVDTFLWDRRIVGSYIAASAEERDRIRAEEFSLVMASVREYPWIQLTASFQNSIIQLISFRNYGFYIDKAGGDLTRDIDDFTQHLEERGPDIVGIFNYILTTIALVVALIQFMGRRSKNQDLTAIIITVLTGLIINATVCGAISEVSDRYQARVVWALPLVVMFSAIYRFSRRNAATMVCSSNK